MSRVALMLVLALALPLSAQEPATVTGRVTISQGAPENATVTLVGTTFTTTTDGSGRYRLTGVPPRQYTISVQSRGGSYTSRTVRLTPGATVTMNIALGVRVRSR